MVTFKFYLPVMILIFLMYYVVNLNGLLDDEMFKDRHKYGIFKFTYPVLEVGFMMFNNFCFFSWIKSCEDIQDHEDDIPA